MRILFLAPFLPPLAFPYEQESELGKCVCHPFDNTDVRRPHLRDSGKKNKKPT